MTMPLEMIFGTLNIFVGCVMVLAGLPLARRRVPMNRRYGFRIPKAFQSDAHWYRINAFGGRQLVRWGVPLLLIGILYFLFPIPAGPDKTTTVMLAIAPMLICPAVAIAKTLLYARRK